MVIAREIFISGKVQGVFYRKYACEAALKKGLKGYVRNLGDGRVYAFVQGEKEKVASFAEWCRSGSPLSEVSAVEEKEAGISAEISSFTIRH
jgi:acylphosphatase